MSTVALLPGDPFRVPLVAEFLTDVKTVAHQREHMTMTGYYKGRHITATSTGMGCPSTAIAVEELIRVGVTSFIRVGSSAGLQVGVKPGTCSSARAPSATTAPRRHTHTTASPRCPTSASRSSWRTSPAN